MNVALPPSSSSPSSSPPPPAESPTTPTPTPTSTTTTSSPAQTPTSSSGSGEPSFMSSPQSGSGTWYDTGLGACGITNNNNQFIAAAAFGMFDNFPNYAGVNPNDNPICGLNVIVYYGGNQVTVTLTDRCAGCTDPTSLDLSPAAFQVLAPLSVGRISITWDWSL
ncbi:hypothetical protein OG21DRAFT_1430245 [Imleria badia]|nr:hypothetical protein OG21DRAFT_1430245 [Imleria badia]